MMSLPSFIHRIRTESSVLLSKHYKHKVVVSATLLYGSTITPQLEHCVPLNLIHYSILVCRTALPSIILCNSNKLSSLMSCFPYAHCERKFIIFPVPISFFSIKINIDFFSWTAKMNLINQMGQQCYHME